MRLAHAILALSLLGCAKVPVVPGPMRAVRDGRVPSDVGAVRSQPSSSHPRARTPEPPQGWGQRLADAAVGLLDAPWPQGFRDDCSGFVCAVSSEAGHRLPSSTQALWTLAEESGSVHRRRRPSPGDLAFFDDTWDRNGNGRLDDDLTHVGVVVEVHEDGSIDVAHVSSSRGRTLLRMNLLRPHDRQDGDVVLNDWLRRKERRDPPRTKYLAGELWRAFATLPDPDALRASR